DVNNLGTHGQYTRFTRTVGADGNLVVNLTEATNGPFGAPAGSHNNSVQINGLQLKWVSGTAPPADPVTNNYNYAPNSSIPSSFTGTDPGGSCAATGSFEIAAHPIQVTTTAGLN